MTRASASDAADGAMDAFGLVSVAPTAMSTTTATKTGRDRATMNEGGRAMR